MTEQVGPPTYPAPIQHTFDITISASFSRTLRICLQFDIHFNRHANVMNYCSLQCLEANWI